MNLRTFFANVKLCFPDIGQKRCAMSRYYYHRASFLSHIFFVLLSTMIFSGARDTTQDDQVSGYWLSNHCVRLSFIDLLTFFHVNVLQKKLWTESLPFTAIFSSFCFSDDFFKNRNSTQGDQFPGYWLSNHCLRLIFNDLLKTFHVDLLRKTQWNFVHIFRNF